MSQDDIDPNRFATHRARLREVDIAYTREGAGGLPIVLLHGWPETRRIWQRNIAPLSAAGFEVIAPDLRGFGDSGLAADGYGDVPAHARDIEALIRHLGHDRVIVAAGDLGGAVAQDLTLRFPGLVQRLVMFNAPIPFDAEAMAGMNTRGAREAGDYFARQGRDADALAAELATPQQRTAYIATFYTSRFWAHPGAFLGDAPAPAGPFGGTPQVDFHTEPFGDAAHLRAGFGAYTSVFDPATVSEPPLMARNEAVRALLLHGASDHVIYPDFDRMAAVVFPDHVGPYRLRDCGHFVPWEAPGPLVSGLVALCADLLGPRSG
jgi:pimeloyl-ACP methyl ester carboxylesterase